VADYVDSDTERIALTPSGTDTLTGNIDAATEDFRFTVSSVEAAQYVDAATKTLALSVSALESKQSYDVGTEDFRFTITSHECYAPANPDFDIDLFKRWNMQSPHSYWTVGSLDNRWHTNIIGTASEILC